MIEFNQSPIAASIEVAYPPFPELVDNTMRGNYLQCPKRFEWAHIHQLAPMAPSIHLHAGGAFAAGIEVCKRTFYEQGKSAEESLRLGLEALIGFYGPVKAPETKTGDKSCDNVIRAFDSYFTQQYPLGRDLLRPHIAANGKAMLEFTFALPTEVEHPQTGDPILYGGRADAINDFGQSLMVSDEKTASQLGEQWARKWNLEAQFTGYVRAALQFGIPVAGVVVRGVGLLKTKITHQEALVYRSQWVVDRWWDQLQFEIQDMVDNWKKKRFRYAQHKDVCGAYGGCEFEMLCTSQEPARFVPIHFRKRVWDPMAKDNGEKLLERPELLEQVQEDTIYVPGLEPK